MAVSTENGLADSPGLGHGGCYFKATLLLLEPLEQVCDHSP